MVLAAAVGLPGKAHALKRLSSQFIALNGELTTLELPADNAAGGTAFYDVTVGAPYTANVLYATVGGTGDVLPLSLGLDNSLLLACRVDGTACNSSKGENNAGASGWTVVQRFAANGNPNTAADQNFHYTWCVPIKPRCPGGSDDASPVSHSVQLRFAAGSARLVSIEQIYVNIDSEKVRNSALACTQGSP